MPLQVTLGQLVHKVGDTMGWLYDIGDRWQHTIKVVEVIGEEESTGKVACLDGAMQCPPEDSNGALPTEFCMPALFIICNSTWLTWSSLHCRRSHSVGSREHCLYDGKNINNARCACVLDCAVPRVIWKVSWQTHSAYITVVSLQVHSKHLSLHHCCMQAGSCFLPRTQLHGLTWLPAPGTAINCMQLRHH